MLVVETIAKIRLAYFSRKMTIKAICRDLRVSRKVVRKVIRSQATEFHYQRDVQPQPKIGPWRERLDTLLLENDGKPARERLTLVRSSRSCVRSAMRALVQIAGAGKRPALYCRDFKLGARHSTLQAQVDLGHPDVPVRIVPCGCDASIRYRRS